MSRAPVAAYELAPAGAPGCYRLSGCFGFATAAAALARGEREFAAHSQVELDLAGVTATDSAGLAVLLAWVDGARKRGHRLRYVQLPEQLLGIAKITETAALLRAAE